jgi:hypothetical protein
MVAVSLRVDLFQIDLLLAFRVGPAGEGVAQPSEEKEENMADAESARRRSCAGKRRPCTGGMADHELIDDHERERFAGTSAVPDSGAGEDR